MILRLIHVVFFLIFLFTTFYFAGVTVLGRAYTQTALAYLLLLVLSVRLFQNRGVFSLNLGGRTGKILLFWIISMFVSSCLSFYVPSSISFWLQLSAYYFLFLICLNLFEQDFLRKIPLFIISVASLLALYGLYLRLLSHPTIFGIAKLFYLDRLTSTFVNPNHLASFLGMSFFLIPFYYQKAEGIHRGLLGLAGGIILAAFFMTFSVGGLAAFGFSGILYLLFHSRFIQQSKKTTPFIVPLFFLAVCIIVLIPVIRALSFSKVYSIWQRASLYKGSWLLLTSQTYPFFTNFKLLFLGAGLDTFYYLIQNFYVNYDITQLHHVHNDYLEFFIEGGLFGLGGFVLFLIFLFKEAFRVFYGKINREEKVFLLGIFSACSFFSLHLFFDFNLRIPANGFLFFILTALLIRTTSGLPQKPAGKRGFYFLLFFMMALGTASYSMQNLIVENLLLRASKYAFTNQFDEAERCYNLVLTLDRHNAKVYEQLGGYYLSRARSQGDRDRKQFLFSKATDQFEKMLEKNNFLPVSHFRTGWAYAYKGDLKKAREKFLIGMEKNPKMLTSYLERARYSLYNNELTLAARDFEFLLDQLHKIPGMNRAAFFRDEIRWILKPFEEIPEFQGVFNRLNNGVEIPGND